MDWQLSRLSFFAETRPCADLLHKPLHFRVLWGSGCLRAAPPLPRGDHWNVPGGMTLPYTRGGLSREIEVALPRTACGRLRV